MYEKFYLHEKILHARNCCRRFIKSLLPEKRKENMSTKQRRFKSQLNQGKFDLRILSRKIFAVHWLMNHDSSRQSVHVC